MSHPHEPARPSVQVLSGPPGALSIHVRCRRTTQARGLDGRPGQLQLDVVGEVFEVRADDARHLVRAGFVEYLGDEESDTVGTS